MQVPIISGHEPTEQQKIDIMINTQKMNLASEIAKAAATNWGRSAADLVFFSSHVANALFEKYIQPNLDNLSSLR